MQYIVSVMTFQFDFSSILVSSSSHYILYITLLISLIIFGLLFYHYFCDCRFFDLDGKLIPGPTSVFKHPNNLSVLTKARRLRKVRFHIVKRFNDWIILYMIKTSEGIYELISKAGDGNMSASDSLNRKVSYIWKFCQLS